MAAHLVRLALVGLGMAAAALVLPNLWVSRVAREHAYPEASSASARSIAIVPGAAVHRDRPMASLRERLETALALYRAGQVKAIFVSGNDLPESPEVPVMQRWLLDRGVAAADIVADNRGSRTRNTMRDAAGAFGISDAIICTQALYVDRAVFLARQAGIDAVGLGVPSPVTRSWRNVGTEALKTALAFYETHLREGPAPVSMRLYRVAVALR